MRIIYFTAQYLPHMGGVENYTKHLSTELANRGHEVVIVTSLIKGEKPYETTKDGVRIYRLPSFMLLGGRYPYLRGNNETRKILRYLSSEKYDLCLVNTRFYALSLAGIKFGFRNNIRTIVIEHGTGHLSVNNKALDYLGEKYEHYLTKKGIKYHPDYCGVSEAANEWLQHFGIKATGVFYNAIDLADVNKARSQCNVDYRKEFNIPSQSTVVTFTGRMIPEKGIQPLIQAASNIIHKGIDAYFLLAGDGPLLEEAQKITKMEDRIKFLGRIDGNHIISLLDSSDIFCLPSVSEGFSTSVLEASACKNYIITTFRGGSKELVSEDRYGKIIPNNKVENVEKALITAILNPKDCKEAAEACCRRVSTNFTWKQTADAVERLMGDE